MQNKTQQFISCSGGHLEFPIDKNPQKLGREPSKEHPCNTLDELHFFLSLEWSFNTGLTACTSK
jgi:hypothetical protein